MTNNDQIISTAKNVLKIEADSILDLIPRLNESFINAVHLILNTEGKIVVTGIGKSGHIARKMASTLSSTGTPSLYLHPAESNHGDLGVINNKDLVVAISYGGEVTELNSIIKFSKRHGIKIISVTGHLESTLGKASDIALNAHVQKEACPLNLAPTSSSTATLALCDALAMSVLELRGFNQNNFAEFHPGGSLGQRLRKVSDVMKKKEVISFLNKSASMKEVLTCMTSAAVRGAAGVIDEKSKLIGIVTDGDIRRFLEKNNRPFEATVEQIMTSHPKTIDCNELVEKALQQMEKNKIQVLIVLDQSSETPFNPVGMVVYQDLIVL
jgi:arabinose-5-phosphate isomerase